MCNCIGIECSQAEIGRVVDEASIFNTESDIFHKGEVGSVAVSEHTCRLRCGTRHRSKTVAIRNEYKRTSLGEQVWTKPEYRRYPNNEPTCCLVNVGLDSRRTGTKSFSRCLPPFLPLWTRSALFCVILPVDRP